MTADCHNVQSVCILIFMIISDREDIHCFEEESCYSMAFGMAMTVLTVAIITFALGKNFYITKAPEGSTIVQATCSIFVSSYTSYSYYI